MGAPKAVGADEKLGADVNMLGAGWLCPKTEAPPKALGAGAAAAAPNAGAEEGLPKIPPSPEANAGAAPKPVGAARELRGMAFERGP